MPKWKMTEVDFIYMYFFQSPWAVIFTNKIITTQHRFGATIYELQRHNFDAKLIIYGTINI